MSLIHLDITHFRNIQSQSLTFNPRVNLILGENGSGKTSLLEAIALFSFGRSFRTRNHRLVISEGAERFTLFSTFESALMQKVGIERARSGGMRIHINGEPTTGIAAMAERFPLQVINPESFNILTDGPKERRKFLDWGVFHVKQPFIDAWRRYQRALKQRNALLRQEARAQEIVLWDRELVEYGLIINEMRSWYLTAFSGILELIIPKLTDVTGISVAFKPGWAADQDLGAVLRESLPRDRALGYTDRGPHRADMVITTQGRPVGDVLSRGQLKILSIALQLTASELLFRESDKRCSYLIDDLPSELDATHVQNVLHLLGELSTEQIFITAITDELLKGLGKQTEHCSMFHVKHGEFRSVD